MTGATSEAGTGNSTGEPECNIGFCGFCFAQSLVFCVVFCRPVFVLFILATILSVLL